MQGLTSTSSSGATTCLRWLTRPWAAIISLVVFCCAAAIAGVAVNRVTAPPRNSYDAGPISEQGSQASAPLLTYTADNLRAVDEEAALALNQQKAVVPIAGPVPSAFVERFSSPGDRSRSIKCLTDAIYYEAANESVDGQRAVAQVILNRVRNVFYPNNICGVVYQGSSRRTGCQFSFTCDGSLLRRPVKGKWERARDVAESAIGGSVMVGVGLSMHYHANYVVPYWSSSLIKTKVIGAHIFYRSPGLAGERSAFSVRYMGAEPKVRALSDTVLSSDDGLEFQDLHQSAEATDPQVAEVSERKARQLDRSGLLDYKLSRSDVSPQLVLEPKLEFVLGAAMAGQNEPGSARRNPD